MERRRNSIPRKTVFIEQLKKNLLPRVKSWGKKDRTQKQLRQEWRKGKEHE